jgi:hypothetical protein
MALIPPVLMDALEIFVLVVLLLYGFRQIMRMRRSGALTKEEAQRRLQAMMQPPTPRPTEAHPPQAQPAGDVWGAEAERIRRHMEELTARNIREARRMLGLRDEDDS